MAAKSASLKSGAQSLPRLLFAREPGWQFSLMLGLEIVFLFVAIPALSAGEADHGVVNLLQLILAGTAIALIAKSTWFRLILAATYGLTLLARLLPGLLPQATTLGVSFAYNFLVTAVMARAVFGAGKVNHHRIAGAIFIYLNVALLFALAFAGLRLFSVNALAGFATGAPVRLSEMVHFSFATLTTIGDGPIIPQSPFAKSLADMEAVIGHLFPAILLSRLVGLHLSRAKLP
jgi:hypothetical protein